MAAGLLLVEDDSFTRSTLAAGTTPSSSAAATIDRTKLARLRRLIINRLILHSRTTDAVTIGIKGEHQWRFPGRQHGGRGISTREVVGA